MTIYGVTEIAQALGVSPDLVRKWRERGKLPEPSAELTAGYVWQGTEIEEWIRQYRAKETGNAR